MNTHLYAFMHSSGQRNFIFHKKRKVSFCSALLAQKYGTVSKFYTKMHLYARGNCYFLSEKQQFLIHLEFTFTTGRYFFNSPVFPASGLLFAALPR